jgi:hypothetical protein
MFRTLRKRFFWKSLSAEVSETVRQCDACARNRIKERTKTSYLDVVPRFLPVGVCFHRPIGTTSENGTWKPLPTRADGSVLQTHPYGAASDYDRICRHEGVL